MRALLCSLVLPLVAALVAGCATPSRPEGMVATTSPAAHRSKESVSVEVVGGQETSAMRTSQISNEAFAQALRTSIENSGVFAQAMAGPGGRYRLQAFIGQVSQPLIGFDMTVVVEVSYTLVDTLSNKTLWQENVVGSYTATVSESVVAVDRVRVANEGAAKLNIQQAIAKLANLNLQ